MDFESALKESQAREAALLARLEASEGREQKAMEEKETLRREKEAERMAMRTKLEALGHFLPFRMPFAGESEPWSPDSVLSHCSGALLPMFDTAEATVLRLLCKEFKETVAQFPWEDDKTVIRGSVAAWKACFPKARWANVRKDGEGGRKGPVVDADFVHFFGLKRLNMRMCTSVTDAAFVHLKGIHTLNMSFCRQSSITDAAFVHLKGIHTLIMWSCWQPTITDAAFVNLKGIHSLNMAYCYQLTITDAAIAHLQGIHSLSLYACPQLTRAMLIHLKGIKRLNIGHCRQPTLTDDSLKGIEWLGMYHCSEAQVEQARSLGYPVDQINYAGV